MSPCALGAMVAEDDLAGGVDGCADRGGADGVVEAGGLVWANAGTSIVDASRPPKIILRIVVTSEFVSLSDETRARRHCSCPWAVPFGRIDCATHVRVVVSQMIRTELWGGRQKEFLCKFSNGR